MIVLKQDESLQKASNARSFSMAKGTLQRYSNTGIEFKETYHPVAIKGRGQFLKARPMAVGFNYGRLSEPKGQNVFGVVARFEDQDAVEKLVNEHPDEIVGVYADPTISIFPEPYTEAKAFGDRKGVERRLGVFALRERKLTGQGVKVAVVDTGINASALGIQLGDTDGWSPDGKTKPGKSSIGHGTMVASDVRIAAPDAKILDYALLQSKGVTWTAFLSDAVAAFAYLIDLIQREPGPLVVNNSWGMFNRAEDAPIGSPENYSANLDHPFNQIVSSLVGAGADVFFAAGNCGNPSPDGRCGISDKGAGASIHGANSHPDVITVAAVTISHRRLGYSSQGPGGLFHAKPDISAYSHFEGLIPAGVHGGTSAASPVAAGVAAALRQRLGTDKVKPAMLKSILQRTAKDVNKNGWDYDFGFGVINAKSALDWIEKPPSADFDQV